MSEASSRRRIAMVVLSVFGGVAVLLAAIGLYGVIAQGVAERRQEIGVRMALGATPGQVLRLFLRHGLIVVGRRDRVRGRRGGGRGRSLASLVFGVTVTDPATLGTVAALLTVVTLLACYMPARSATRVDPLEALAIGVSALINGQKLKPTDTTTVGSLSSGLSTYAVVSKCQKLTPTNRPRWISRSVW